MSLLHSGKSMMVTVKDCVVAQQSIAGLWHMASRPE